MFKTTNGGGDPRRLPARAPIQILASTEPTPATRARDAAAHRRESPRTRANAARQRAVHDRAARAAGRIAFGLVMLAGAGVLVRDALAGEHRAVTTLVTTWLGAIAVGGLTQLFLDGSTRTGVARAHVAVSWVTATVGIALLLPLSLHAVFALAVDWLDGFDDWVYASLLVSGPAHLVFAGLVGLRAHQLATGRIAIRPARIFATTVIVSCIPFVLLFGLPPLVVGLTGLVIHPLLGWMADVIGRDVADGGVPTASVHLAKKDPAHA